MDSHDDDDNRDLHYHKPHHLMIRVFLPWEFINQTRGLFGNWSFDTFDENQEFDDFTLPNGDDDYDDDDDNGVDDDKYDHLDLGILYLVFGSVNLVFRKIHLILRILYFSVSLNYFCRNQSELLLLQVMFCLIRSYSAIRIGSTVKKIL